jgi:hypothetical protein
VEIGGCYCYVRSLGTFYALSELWNGGAQFLFLFCYENLFNALFSLVYLWLSICLSFHGVMVEKDFSKEVSKKKKEKEKEEY